MEMPSAGLFLAGAALLAGVFFSVGALAGRYFYRVALLPKQDAPKNIFSAPSDSGLSESRLAYERERAELQAWAAEAGMDDLFETAFDGLRLHANYIRNSTDKWAVILHRYRGRGTSMLSFARRFHERGYNILLPDARGHGQSEGGYIGMGWHDRLDVLVWLERLIRQFGDIRMIVFGESMGAATAMMLSGETLPANVKAIIEDCGFSSVRNEFVYQLKSLYKLPVFPILYFADRYTRRKAGYAFHEADAVRQVKKSKTPMLFLHGDSDRFIPSYMLDEVFCAAACPKERLIIEGAGHTQASRVGGERYWRAVDGFLSQYS